MRIGIDARLWNQTGVGRYIRNLVINLERIDKKNEYILFARGEDLKQSKIQNPKFKIITADISWHSIEEQLKFPLLLNKYNLDLIHFPYISVPIFYNKPFVVTIHDLIPLHFPTGKASTLPLPIYGIKQLGYRYVLSSAAKRAKKIISPSNSTKKDIVEYLKIPKGKIEVIYEGVDENLKNKEISKKENILLYVGNAYPHKNLTTLLYALKNSEISFIKLIMVGKEDYFYKRLKNKVKEMNLEDRVKFQGLATEEELSLLYKRAKAVIIPSFIEGFGLPALEGMANGCQVLASDIPVLHEVSKDAAIYFDPRNINDLVQKLKSVYSGEKSNKINIKRGLERAKEFSWGKTAKETLKLYESSVSLR